MDGKLFKEQFIVTFLATWCANEYNNACMNGEQERLSHPPVEDAIFLSKEAWVNYLEHNTNDNGD